MLPPIKDLVAGLLYCLFSVPTLGLRSYKSGSNCDLLYLYSLISTFFLSTLIYLCRKNMKRPWLRLRKWRRGWLWQNQCWRLHCNTNLAKLKLTKLHHHLQGTCLFLIETILFLWTCWYVNLENFSHHPQCSMEHGYKSWSWSLTSTVSLIQQIFHTVDGISVYILVVS